MKPKSKFVDLLTDGSLYQTLVILYTVQVPLTSTTYFKFFEYGDYLKIKVKLSLYLTPLHEGVFCEWRWSSTYS